MRRLVFASDGGLAESTPLRDRMALYQAAISKQDATPVNVSTVLVTPPQKTKKHKKKQQYELSITLRTICKKHLVANRRRMSRPSPWTW